MKSKCYGLLNKPKTPKRCGFSLANPHSAENAYTVAESNLLNQFILLC